MDKEKQLEDIDMSIQSLQTIINIAAAELEELLRKKAILKAKKPNKIGFKRNQS